jgi:PAS domain S-box-containing protein
MKPGAELGPREQARDLSATLRAHREETLTRWADLCRQTGKARSLSDEQLIDHLPRLLDRLASALEAASEGRDTSVPTDDSRAHAMNRLDTGFDLPEIAQEYALLRRVLFAIVAERAPHLVIGGLDVVGTAIDESLSESVEYYVRVRHRTLEALDQVAQVVTGPGDIDTILHRLLSVTMHTIPSVDAVTVLLRQGDLLRVKEALGVMAGRDRSFSLKVGEGFAGTIAATGQPMFLSSADIAPIIQSAFIREKNLKAMYGVPMVRGTFVLGVAHMASLTAHEFAEEDKLLFRTVAERATSVIAQGELMVRERATRLFLETVISNIKEGVMVADKDGRIVLASEGAARIFGTTREALATRVEEFERRFRPRSLEGEPRRPAIVEALQGRETPPHERVVTDEDGREHVLIVSAAPVAENGSMTGAVVVFVDVTERRSMEDELRRAAAFRERVLGIVSHDLRSPLSAISMATHSVLARETAPDWAVSSALRVKRSVERMTRMVSDLLDFTRVQAHSGLPLERRRVDLCAVVREAVDELELAHPNRIELKAECGKALGQWDADRLAQVVINLASNALEHGSREAPIQVRVADEGATVKLSVTNRGQTISPGDLPTLFDPFRRASGGEVRGGGLGLGLYIVHEVARAHGGSVEVASQHGVTTFAVTLPKEPGDAGAHLGPPTSKV